MTRVPVEPKEERQGWPAPALPDRKPPAGWSLPLIVSTPRIHHHALAPDGRSLAFVLDQADGLADLPPQSSEEWVERFLDWHLL